MAPVTPRRPAGTRSRTGHIRAQLSRLDRDRLVDLLVEAAEGDPALARRLTLAAARTDGDLAALGDAVGAVFGRPEQLAYWPAIRYAEAAAEVADALAELVGDGRAAESLPLIEQAIALLVEAAAEADDSAGALSELMGRLLRMHVEACRSARPPVDPAALARWLLHMQLGGQERFTIEIADYAQALGADGLAAYRRGVQAQWAVRPGDVLVRRAREGLARLDRDVAALIEVVGGDLRHAAQYGRLARALRDAGEHAAAIEWAERGLRAHPDDPPGAGLRDFLVEAYLSRDGGTQALRLRREGLAVAPVLHSYVALRAAARLAGRWETERPAALALLAHRNPGEHVRARLAEDDVDGAWRAARKVRDLPGSVWDELAGRRATTHPADVVDVLRGRIDEVLAAAGRDVYRDAVRRLHRLREVCQQCGRGPDFDEYIADLAERHRRRPAFLAELSRAGLTARGR